MAYQSTNPYNGKVVKTFDEISDKQLEDKLKAAQDCFEQVWRRKSFAQRNAVLSRAAAIMRERSQEFAELITIEMGKLIQQSQGEVALSAAILDYYAEHAEAFLAPERLTTPKGEALVESSPIGVLFGVEPWNYPYYQVTRFAAPNLMAGNVVMVKHASNVPKCALAFERLLEEAGAPPGAYTNLFISKDQVAKVIDDAAWNFCRNRSASASTTIGYRSVPRPLEHAEVRHPNGRLRRAFGQSQARQRAQISRREHARV